MPPLNSLSSKMMMKSPARVEHGGPDSVLFFREKIKKPNRKFNARQRHYHSLNDDDGDDDDNDDDDDDDDYDNIEDHDFDVQSFSSMRLARDMDKPTKKYLGTWKATKPERNAKRPLSSTQNSRFSALIVDQSKSEQKPVLSVSLEHADAGKMPLIFPRKNDSRTKPKDSLLSYFGGGVDQSKNSNDSGWSPNLTMPTSPKENRHPQNIMSCDMCAALPGDDPSVDASRPALRALNFPSSSRESTVQMAGVAKTGDSNDRLLVALQVVRLKKEMKKKKERSSQSKTVHSLGKTLAQTQKRVKKSVKFCEPLVTEVTERPFTEKEDMETLYFVHGELEELEWDRSTVDNDQFECILEEEDQEAFIEVEHTSRNLHVIRPGELPHSLSDLSFY
mmetsp:Transcript_12799/g.16773  ORF Transcript_12799/g.16773 Transcript_12799/m.16773 type:complete len:391 (-) Transcript_12799:140-1312(-)|eukprot:CAMPEP_0198147012 /NCGR_PEP_ID=MMETSP1443-20131203/32805_1 /TAXON_ID=186043 /ORGANISM="Entomoneis sp., Strain CCMP2396" /LENGTH=390 /DNA_ID=CAMNT_0043811143 /DNA_START=103 /DNA_END=1275 /DNA_ORIENTATION=+